jgi:hypothetical protein
MRYMVGRRVWSVVMLAACVCGSARLGLAQTPVLTVDATDNQHPINPDIYGIASYGLDAGFAKEIQVPNVRWGGDGTTRYNWMVDSSNAGFDWYFMGGNGQAPATPSASADLMVSTYKTASNARALVTIPIIPYVNKTAAWNCSFPVSVYGAQQSTNPYVHPNGDNCGNSLTTSGAQLMDNNIYANHIDNTTALQTGWVQHLVTTFGTAANGGVPYYQLDNEPGGWSNTHRDVEPVQPDYDTIISLGQQYAAAIKQADNSAKVFGPVDFTLGGWIGTPSKQNGLFAGQYYLQQMAEWEQANHHRILDYFDEHYYGGGATDAAELASTRALWDSAFNSGSWVEQYYFDGPMMLLPRFENWIATYYPGTKLSLSEYSFSNGTNPLVDALTEADVLGIYGREGLDFANMWNAPKPTDAVAYSFRVYRNYDGAGGQFGDTSVNATSSDQSQLSVYGALRSGDGALTVVAINKTTKAISTSLTLANFNTAGTAAVYSYSNANLTHIVAGAPVAVASGALSYTFPAYSATVLVFTPASTAATATAIRLSASATRVSSGQSVTFTATVTATSGTGTPTGSVNFFDGTAQIGTVVLNASGVAIFSLSNLGVGAHSVTAVYAGDANFSASTSNVASITVAAAAKINTATVISASATQVTAGQVVSFTAMVTPASGSSMPTGSVTFFDGQTQIGTGTVNGLGVATFSTSSFSAGTHSVTASYGGDENFAPSTSSGISVTLAPAKTATTTALAASAIQVTSGQSVLFTTMVMPTSGSGTPTGSVTFLDGPTSIGAATLSGEAGSFSFSTLSVGVHNITAMYSGDANFAASASPGISVTVTVPAKTGTTTLLIASALQVTIGQSATWTAKVVATSGTGTPTGSVTFFDGQTSIGTAMLSGGTASLSTGGLGLGTHTITAMYSGDANFSASTSSAVSVIVAAPPKIATVTMISTSATQLTSGQSVTFMANVKAQSGSGAPTGTIVFLDSGSQLGSATLSAGAASFTSATLAAGTHTIAATYGGDADYVASNSAAETVTVAAAPTADYSLSMSSSSLTLAPGASGTLTITVTPKNGFKQVLGWTCSNLPAGGSCSFGPESTNAANGVATTTLTVNAPSGGQAEIPLREPFSGVECAALWLLAMTGVFVTAVTRGRQAVTGMARWAPAFAAAGLLAVVLGMQGCASTSQGLLKTTAYDVTVEASASNAPTHTGQFRLTVIQ